VWFGSCPIVEAQAEETEAARAAVLMERRFAGLRITNEPEQYS
jgi:hypothetical protein